MSIARVVRPCCWLLLLVPFAAASQAPVARVQPVTDDYYGTQVVDPYRWMESGRDPDWLPWLEGQAKDRKSVV